MASAAAHPGDALAVGITTLIALLVFVIPFWLVVTTLVAHRDEVPRLILAASAFRIPQPPRCYLAFRAVGPYVVTIWQEARDAGIPELASRIRPYAGQVHSGRLASSAASVEWLCGSS